MIIRKAEYIKSSPNIRICPEEKIPEFAFIGRSNVGKSSLINMLVRRKNLAKTSGKPGKTRMINHFRINDNWHLVDLPGYGYAGVSKADREKWIEAIREYLLKREFLFCLFVLIDSRHEPQEIDLSFVRWLGEKGIPFSVVFTKCDKLSQLNSDQNISLFEQTLLEEWESLPPLFRSSAISAEGRDKILNYIEGIIKSQGFQA